MTSPTQRPLQIEVPLNIKTYDIDFAGIVSNIVYIRWLEDLRLKILDVHLPIAHQIEAGFGPIITKTEIAYRGALTIHDKPVARMWVESVRKVRCALVAEFSADQQIAATARQECCFVDLDTKRPIAVPSLLVDRFREQT